MPPNLKAAAADNAKYLPPNVMPSGDLRVFYPLHAMAQEWRYRLHIAAGGKPADDDDAAERAYRKRICGIEDAQAYPKAKKAQKAVYTQE